jgi:hypothetical protein
MPFLPLATKKDDFLHPMLTFFKPLMKSSFVVLHISAKYMPFRKSIRSGHLISNLSLKDKINMSLSFYF